MEQPLLLQAFEGTNTVIPVWFMRQAGRYLPEYQRIKERHSLNEMFANPELAAEITCLPIKTLNVDAAILFADILTLPSLMGIKITFDNKRGPLIQDGLTFERVHDIEGIAHVETAIQLAKKRLTEQTPLIGFAGSPFTVMTYLIEGGSSLQLRKTMKFIHEHHDLYNQWMEKLTQNTIRYLKAQIQAGADLIQLFDTWAGVLRPTDYAHWVLPYIRQIFDAIDAPSIYYVKNCSHLLALMDTTAADFLSVCHTVVLGHHTIIEKTQKGIQGNLHNGLLYADQGTIEKEVKDVLVGGIKHPRYIFNLSHGVFPDVDPNVLKRIVEQVHAFQWDK